MAETEVIAKKSEDDFENENLIEKCDKNKTKMDEYFKSGWKTTFILVLVNMNKNQRKGNVFNIDLFTF